MLLRHSLGDDAGAQRIERAVEAAFARGARTRELTVGGNEFLNTQRFTDCVLDEL
jgi:3-isopropylmalate dehydrogenase